MKPHKGTLHYWEKVPFSAENERKFKEFYPDIKDVKLLGYTILGFRSKEHKKLGTATQTSPIVKHEGNEIETLNSRYTLGESDGQSQHPDNQSERRAEVPFPGEHIP